MQGYKNIVSALEECAKGSKGITFISGAKDEEFISYKELYDSALGMLNNLQNLGMSKNQELIVQVGDNKDFILTLWACLMGGIIPVPVTVGNNDEHKLKLFKIWKTLNTPHLITDSKTLEDLKQYIDNNDIYNLKEQFKKNTISLENMKNITMNGNLISSQPEDIAFIQFSSGSTGDPKGVIVTHENLMVNTKAIAKCSGMNQQDITLNWMPLTHDMGLIGFHFTSIVVNVNQYSIPTSLFVRNPTLWLKKTSEHKPSHLYSPNFGYKHFLTFYKPHNAEDWDLSSVRVIFNGAEPISVELCNKFLQDMEGHKLDKKSMFTVYGLAEGTVAVCFPPIGEQFKYISVDRRSLNVGQKIVEIEAGDINSLTFVDEGSPVDDCFVRICEDNNKELEDDTVGNIQIKGKSVTRGYYNNPEATAKVITEDGWLSTGDLGFMRNGRLVITGRAKDIIFVNGQNYYPHDIERIAEEIDGCELGKVAVCGAMNKKTQKEDIIVFVLFKKKLDDFVSLAIRLKRHISVKMGLEVEHVIPIKKIPKTTSGKVQRYKLGQMFDEGQFSEIVNELGHLIEVQTQNCTADCPTTDVEGTILEVFREVLNTELIGIDDNFSEFGTTSLLLSQIVEKLENLYPGKIDITNIYAYATIAELAEYLSEEAI